MRRTLVTGGIRSGKSRVAERLYADAPNVAYIAAGQHRVADDLEWSARVALHKARRPASWTTIETTDLAGAIAAADGPVLVDSLGSWLQAVLDRLDAWTEPELDWLPDLVTEIDLVVQEVVDCEHEIVFVTNEVGLGLVSEHRSGRVYADQLGLLNQAIAPACDDVLLVVAGRTITL